MGYRKSKVTEPTHLEIAIEPEIDDDSVSVDLADIDPTPMRLMRRIINSLNLRYNEVTMRIENEEGTPQTDRDLASMWVNIVEKTPKLKKQDFYDFILSNEIPAYNPIKNFIEANLHRNPKGCIDTIWASLPIKRKDKAPFLAMCFRKWVIGMVASLDTENKTVINLLMPILIGPIHKGKSGFFSRLLPKDLESFYTKDMLEAGNDSRQMMCSMILILADDLEKGQLKTTAKFRQFISAEKYTFRIPYRDTNETFKRTASLCGSSNHREILVEAENNRRMIPIEISAIIDFDCYNSVDKTDLFIEAWHAYKSGESWELTEAESIELSKISQSYEEPDIYAEYITKFFSVPEKKTNPENILFLQASEIVQYIIESVSGEDNKGLKLPINKVGEALGKCGFKRVSKKRNCKAMYCYAVVKI
jgi:predicted P-loop ATPase